MAVPVRLLLFGALLILGGTIYNANRNRALAREVQVAEAVQKKVLNQNQKLRCLTILVVILQNLPKKEN